MHRKPVGVAYDQTEDSIVVVCDDGAVFGLGDGVREWRALYAIPGTQKDKDDRASKEARDA